MTRDYKRYYDLETYLFAIVTECDVTVTAPDTDTEAEQRRKGRASAVAAGKELAAMC
jgi:hypothetical protein